MGSSAHVVCPIGQRCPSQQDPEQDQFVRMATRWSFTILSPFGVALLLLQPLPLLGGKLALPPLPSTGPPGDELGFA